MVTTKTSLYHKYIIFGLVATMLNFTMALTMPIPTDYSNKLSAIVVDANSGETIYSYNANTPRLVASNMKLFTTLFALQVLKPNFHWTTKLYYMGTIQNHQLNGNVYIKGAGDPTLTSQDIKTMLQQLTRLGIYTINGNIIIDDKIFNSQPKVSMLEDSAYDSDTVTPHGLIIDGNLTTFTLQINNSAITLDSNLYGYNIVNNLAINRKESNCIGIYKDIEIKKNDSVVTLDGRISPTCDNKTIEYFLLPNLTYNSMVIDEALEDAGIAFNGNYQRGTIPLTAKLVIAHKSKALEQILMSMNKFSINLIAETIISSAGAYTTNNKDTFADGSRLFNQFLAANHLTNPELNLENGAGLSRHEYVSVTNIADLLLLTKNSIYYNDFLTTLALPGESGTLKTTLLPFKKELHAKSGTLVDTKAYSGYFYAKNGKHYIVSVVINGIDTRNYQQVQQFENWLSQLLMALD